MRDIRAGVSVAHGVWTTIADPVVVGLAARAGFDYTCIDMQHGLATDSDLPTLLRYLRGTPTTTVVRVPAADFPAIGRALDLGADGVVVPMVENAEQAALAVAAARYPTSTPPGRRSWGPIFADLDGVTPPHVADPLVIVMIETPGAFEAVEEIASVPGVDALYVGPYDLALSSGFGQQIYRDDPEIERRIQHVVDTAIRHDLIPAVHCTDLQMVHDWRERGARMLTTGLDTTLVSQAFATRYAEASGDPA